MAHLMPMLLTIRLVSVLAHPGSHGQRAAKQVLLLFAFSALTRQEGHPACRKRVVGCWRAYMSGVMCRFAYGPAAAIATHYLLLQ